MGETLKQLGLILGGWTLVITAIATWLSGLISQRMIQSWKSHSEKDLELLRDTLAYDRIVLEKMVSNLNSNQSLSQEQRLKGIEKLWSTVIKLRENFSSVIFFSVYYYQMNIFHQ